MRPWKTLCFSTFLVSALFGLSSGVSGQSAPPPQIAQTTTTDQPQPQAAAAVQVKTVDQAIDRIIAREHDQVTTMQRFKPVVETYIQDMKPDKDLGSVPIADHYFLGQADLGGTVQAHSMLANSKKGGALDNLNPIFHLNNFFSSAYSPDVFVRMIYLDTNGFDRSHYQFEYVRREFLGEVRCLVFDITPTPDSGKGRFKGRIWAEDQNFTVIRFNGVFTPVGGINGFNLHFDSWRLNVQPGMWLPAYVFSQESGREHTQGGVIRFKAQTRLWGYNLKNTGGHEEFTAITVQAPGSALLDQDAPKQDSSPIQAEREWRHQAEVNVLDSLERAGLLAPAGPADKVFEVVINNLEVGNNLDVQPEVRCRVMLTGTLEMFTIGHTIVLSRGLIDVLPDEASLATMLAQELADILLIKPSTDQWGFNDTTSVSMADALSHLTFRDSPEQVQQANQKALELMKNSIYKDKLASAGLFLKQLNADAKALPALINPRLGNGISLADQLVTSAPNLDSSKLDQISALPLGARLKLDPWTDQVSLIKAPPVTLISVREKMPFELTPFMPFVTRYHSQD